MAANMSLEFTGEFVIALATPSWSPDGQPFPNIRRRLFSKRKIRLDEARHVFLKHNQLPERWAAIGRRANISVKAKPALAPRAAFSGCQLWDSMPLQPSAFLLFWSGKRKNTRSRGLTKSVRMPVSSSNLPCLVISCLCIFP